MSTDITEPDESSGTETREVEKDVTIEAYAPMPDGKLPDKREFLDTVLLTDIDWYERKTTESTVYKLVLPNGREIDVDSDDFETLQADIAAGDVSNDDIAVREDTETDSRHRHRTFTAGRKFRDRLMESLPDSIESDAGVDYYKSMNYYVGSDGEEVVSIRASVGKGRILQHQSRRSDDNKYQTDEYTRRVTVNCSFGPATSDDVNEASETIVPAVVKALRQEAWCERVRVAECKVEREGDCFV